ncbi:hypothetical protein [Streptomyces sp. NPDC020996]|uniref:hypothetical protein n=1 Tax=unclassified Streptomyces TaxID=2593676 RepID=UPI0033C3AD0D
MAKNKNRKQGGNQMRSQRQAPERAEQQTAVATEASSPADVVEHGRKPKKLGHN